MLPSSIPVPLPGGLRGPLPRFLAVGQQFSTDTIESIDVVVAKEFQKFEGVNLKGKSCELLSETYLGTEIQKTMRHLRFLPKIAKCLRQLLRNTQMSMTF